MAKNHQTGVHFCKEKGNLLQISKITMILEGKGEDQSPRVVTARRQLSANVHTYIFFQWIYTNSCIKMTYVQVLVQYSSGKTTIHRF